VTVTTAIDLSRLGPPEIDGLLLSPGEIAGEIAALVRAAGYPLPADPTAADPMWRVALAFAEREANLRRQIYDAALALTLPYGAGHELDLIGATYYGVERKPEEEDDMYRRRLAATPERFAIGLSRDWYEQNALAIEGVVAARLQTPTPGTVDIHIQADHAKLADDGSAKYADGVPDQALLDLVKRKLTASDVRQQTDVVNVKAGAPVKYTLSVSLKLYAEPDSSMVLDAARHNLEMLLGARHRLGETVSAVVVAGAVMVAGVRDATITITRASDSKEVDEIEGGLSSWPWATDWEVEVGD